MDSRMIRELLLNKEQTDSTVRYFIEEKMKEQEASSRDYEKREDYLKIFRYALETFYPSGVEDIYRYSESHIERIFLNSLLLSFLFCDPLGFVIRSPHPNIPLVVQEQRERLQSMLEMDKEIKDTVGGDENFLTYLKYLFEEKIIDEESYRSFKNEFMAMHGLDFYHAFFLVMQAGFADIKVDGRSIRADMFIYIPGDKNFNLIVECDGFKYHSDKESFISDRKRDRILKDNGFDVLRFSGSEIFNDPAGAGIELYEYLQKRRVKNGVDV